MCNDVLNSGQADTWGSSQGAMFESVLRTSCEIVQFGWSKDRAPVDTFILGLATSIRGRNDYDEEVTCTPFAHLLQHNLTCFEDRVINLHVLCCLSVVLHIQMHVKCSAIC